MATEKILVQGLLYETPQIPHLKEIRGYHLPKKDQIWSRRTEYEQWNWNIDEKEGDLWTVNASDEQMKWYFEEIERLHVGDWVMINGKPTYFNKYCYFFFQWFMLQEQAYPLYKEVCLEYFRFFELCEKDEMCLGDCGIKGRRLGLSSMSASIKLLIAITENNTLQGIVSKTGTDAYEMFLFVKNGMENLPHFLMPDLNKVTESEIHVAKPAVKISKNNTRAKADKGKNNRINWLDTSEKAYDGRAVRHVTIDEAAKWVKYNVRTCLSKISDTLVIGAEINGHVSLFSTVDKGDQGGDNFKIIWEDSNHIDGKKDKYGRTATRMKRFFIPAYNGYQGYIGKYGESIIENPTKEQTEFLKKHINPITKKRCPDPTVGAKEWLEEIRRGLSHDSESLAEEMRKNPFEWQEVFRDANNMCHFNIEEVNNQIERIDSLLEGTGKKENGRRIRFTSPDSYVDDPNGFWYILKFPNHVNKHTYKGSVKCPDNTDYGAAGMDTYANARATVDKGSDACVIIHSRYDSLNPETSDEPVAMFLGRPLTKRDFHNQVFWGLQYYGVMMLAERSPTDWEDYAIENNLASSLDAPKRYGYLAVTKRANDSEVYGVAPQDKQQREQHLTEMKEYANNKIHKIWFKAILKNMIPFDIDNRTDYDACMAWGYSLMCLKGHVPKIAKKAVNKLQILKVFNKSA